MSKYTTGEVAKLCGVSVRTIQYYDARGVVCPSELSEGGRRLYSQENLERLRIACFLRELGLSLNDISSLFQEEGSGEVISLLLQQQVEALQRELAAKQEQLCALQRLIAASKDFAPLSVQTIGDIALTMDRQKKLRRLHGVLLTIGILADLIWLAAIALWVFRGTWIPFAVAVPVNLLLCTWLTWLYRVKTVYICPHCHAVFKPLLREFLFSRHTPRTRTLTCPACQRRSNCVETYQEEPLEDSEA